ncbi:substrate-binding periplasmic protein [Pseudodesulfovibrio alkaliphilus]|nr:transporter substrate-binding domain-containing protein [Pseudodesulfovibrio alkaliphilus]
MRNLMPCQHLVIPGMVLVLGILLSCNALRADEVRLVYEDFPPFEYQQEGEARGDSVVLIRRVCAELGLVPVFMNRPWARAVDDVRSGHADGIFSLFRSAEREKWLHFAEQPLAYEDTVVFVARGDLQPGSLEDLAGLRVGVVRGYHYGPDVSTRLPESPMLFKDVEALLAMLCEGRIDAALATRRSGEHVLERLGGCADRARVVLELARMPLHIAFSRRDEVRARRLADMFSRVLARLGADDGTNAEPVNPNPAEP